jgi:hypothetical protein
MRLWAAQPSTEACHTHLHLSHDRMLAHAAAQLPEQHVSQADAARQLLLQPRQWRQLCPCSCCLCTYGVCKCRISHKGPFSPGQVSLSAACDANSCRVLCIIAAHMQAVHTCFTQCCSLAASQYPATVTSLLSYSWQGLTGKLQRSSVFSRL